MSDEKTNDDDYLDIDYSHTHALDRHPEYVSAIGMILLETVDLELALADILAGLLTVPRHIGRAVFLSPKGEQARLDMLSNAVNAITTPPSAVADNLELMKERAALRKRILTLVSKCQKATNMRHRIVHDGWWVEDNGTEVLRFPINGKYLPQAEAVSLNELQNHILLLRDLIASAYKAAAELSGNRVRIKWMMKLDTNSG